jgi:hypothetical protein
MSRIATAAPATQVSTFGIRPLYGVAYAPDSVKRKADELQKFEYIKAYQSYPVVRREVTATRPQHRAVYFEKLPESATIQYYAYCDDVTCLTPDRPNETLPRGIDSSLSDITAALLFKSRAEENDTSCLLRQERVVAPAKGGKVRGWFDQEKKDYSEVFFLFLCARHHKAVGRLPELFGRLSKMATLVKGWNGYSATPPTAAAIKNAKALLTRACAVGIIPERVEPSAMGGVGVTFSAGSREAAVEFYNNGTAHALFADSRTEDLDTEAVTPNADGYGRFLARARRHLHVHPAAAQAP